MASGDAVFGQQQGAAGGQAVDLTGVWEKDSASSNAQSYEAMLDLLGLSGLQRVTARLIEGLDIRHTADGLAVNFVTVVPFFRVTEATKFDAPVSLMRRDLRPGKQTARAQPVEGGVAVRFEWPEPLAGSLVEVYTLARGGGGNEMSVASTLSIGGKTVNTVQVYRRSGKDKTQLLRESRARNASMQEVLARQKAQFGDK